MLANNTNVYSCICAAIWWDSCMATIVYGLPLHVNRVESPIRRNVQNHLVENQFYSREITYLEIRFRCKLCWSWETKQTQLSQANKQTGERERERGRERTETGMGTARWSRCLGYYDKVFTSIDIVCTCTCSTVPLCYRVGFLLLPLPSPKRRFFFRLLNTTANILRLAMNGSIRNCIAFSCYQRILWSSPDRLSWNTI